MSDPTADEPTNTDEAVAADPVVASEAAAPAPAPAPMEPPIYTPPASTPSVDPAVSLDEFMENLSRADSRVSLVNAFALQARVSHLNRATTDEFSAAYVAFCNAPA